MKHLVKWLLAHIVHFIFLSLYVNIYSVFIVCVDICVGMYILCVVCISACMCMLYVYTQAHLYGIHELTLGDFLNLSLYYDLRHDLSRNMKALIWIDWQASYPCGSSCFLCSGRIIADDFFIICFFFKNFFSCSPFQYFPQLNLINHSCSPLQSSTPSPTLLPPSTLTRSHFSLEILSISPSQGDQCVSLLGFSLLPCFSWVVD